MVQYLYFYRLMSMTYSSRKDMADSPNCQTFSNKYSVACGAK